MVHSELSPQAQELQEDVVSLQCIVNGFLNSSFRQYVIDRKLHLLDSSFQNIDNLLTAGILTVNNQ